jgi:hypothetical protein
VPNTRVDVCCGALERWIASGVVAVVGHGRVGDAPVGAPRVIDELRAGLASAVAQSDDMAEPAAGEDVQIWGRWVERSMPNISRSTWIASRCSWRFGRVPALVTVMWSAVW